MEDRTIGYRIFTVFNTLFMKKITIVYENGKQENFNIFGSNFLK